MTIRRKVILLERDVAPDCLRRLIQSAAIGCRREGTAIEIGDCDFGQAHP
jgi:hypothetical protein